MQNKTPVIIGAIVLVIIIVLAAVLYLQPHSATAPTQTASSTATGNAAVGASGQSQVITYTDSGFSPASVTVAEGTTVTWVNNSSLPMWVASNNHPDHTLYDGTSMMQHCVSGAPTSASVFDECTSIPSGGSFSFTFDKVGSWGYHNHAHESDKGTVVVTAGKEIQSASSTNINPNAIPE